VKPAGSLPRLGDGRAGDRRTLRRGCWGLPALMPKNRAVIVENFISGDCRLFEFNERGADL